MSSWDDDSSCTRGQRSPARLCDHPRSARLAAPVRAQQLGATSQVDEAEFEGLSAGFEKP